jgi:DNA-binding MarR family transcriptional regulator
MNHGPMNHGPMDLRPLDGQPLNGQPPERLPLADELGTAIMEISMRLRRAILPPGISLTQAGTLLALRNGPQRVTVLAEAVQVTQPTMSALVIAMEQLGWVRRDTDGADRRAVAVCLTQTGEKVIRDLEAARTRALLVSLDTLPAPDLAALAAAIPALRRITQHRSKAVAS